MASSFGCCYVTRSETRARRPPSLYLLLDWVLTLYLIPDAFRIIVTAIQAETERLEEVRLAAGAPSYRGPGIEELQSFLC